MKYLNGQSLVGVNPDPHRYDGALLPFIAGDMARLLPELLAHRRPLKAITMAHARLSDGQQLYAVNDLFVGPKTHTSARYEITLEKVTETQSSSGIIVATGLGSTAWMRSIFTGAAMLMHEAVPGQPEVPFSAVPWDAPYLRFAVREPFPSIATQTTLVSGKTDRRSPLIIRSLMPENGVIFSDGIEADFVEFTSGIAASISVADKVGQLVY